MLSFCLLLTYCTINVSLRFVRVAQVIIIISKQQLKEYSHLDGVERLQPLFGRYTICAQEHIIVFLRENESYTLQGVFRPKSSGHFDYDVSKSQSFAKFVLYCS